MSWLDDAYYYTELGFSVVPIIPVGDEKKPAVYWREYQQRQPTDEELGTWNNKWPDAKLAIVTGAVSGIVILDLDEEPAITFATEKGLTSPIRVQTKRGYHLYFRHPGHRIQNRQGSKPGKGWPKLKGLDLRGDGGYAVLPSEDNANKTWEIDPSYSLNDLSELPIWNDDLVMPPAPDDILDLSNVMPDSQLEDEWQSTKEYVEQRYPETGKLPTGESNGRNQRVFNYLSQCILKGMRDDELVSAGRTFMAEFFLTPLPDCEYLATVQSAWSLEVRNHPERFDANGNYTYQHPSLSSPTEELAIVTPEPEATTDRPRYSPYTIADLAQLEADIADQDFLITPWLRQGSITQVFGYTGHGKSTVLYRVLYHLARGIDFSHVFDIAKPAKVLYFDWENGKATVSRHMATMLKSYKDAGNNWGMWIPALDDIDLKTQEGLGTFGEWIKVNSPQVIVIDTVRSAFSGMTENDADTWARLNQIMIQLRNAGFAVIWVHHANKPDNVGNLGREAGSSNQLTVTETQLRVTLLVHDEAEAQMKGAKTWRNLPREGIYDELLARLPHSYIPRVGFEISYGKVREWTDDHQQVQYILIGEHRETGEEMIVSNRNKRRRALAMAEQGFEPEEIAKQLYCSTEKARQWLGTA